VRNSSQKLLLTQRLTQLTGSTVRNSSQKSPKTRLSRLSRRACSSAHALVGLFCGENRALLAGTRLFSADPVRNDGQVGRVAVVAHVDDRFFFLSMRHDRSTDDGDQQQKRREGDEALQRPHEIFNGLVALASRSLLHARIQQPVLPKQSSCHGPFHAAPKHARHTLPPE